MQGPTADVDESEFVLVFKFVPSRCFQVPGISQ